MGARFSTTLLLLTLATYSAWAQTKRVVRDDVVRDAESMEKYTNIALLVGIGDYDKALTGLPPLKYPVPDIAAVGGVLKQQGYEVALLTDRAATAGAVRETIRELSKALDKGQGTFLFYFSGHGFRAGAENYLATFGTTASDLANQGLSLKEVQRLLLSTGARRRMAFIDACRNDPDNARAVAGTTPRSFQDLQESEGLRILYSTAPGEVSYEDETLQHGVFSYFLIDGLQGKAANPKDGLITFDDLRDYVTKEMRTYGISKRRIQKPYQLGESTGDFLLAAKALPAGAPPAAPASPVKDPGPVSPPPAGVATADNDTARSIKTGGAMDNVLKKWRSTLDNRIYTVSLDPQNLIIKLPTGEIIADLQFQPKDKKYAYKGKTRMPPASTCPGGLGEIRLRSATPTRLELDIQTPTASNQGPSCMLVFGLGTWAKASLVVEN